MLELSNPTVASVAKHMPQLPDTAPGSAPRSPLSEADLTDLVARIARERCRGSFALLFRHFAPRLKAYGMKAGADAQTAEEVAQEAMIAVWRKAETFDRSKASVSTWVFTIVRNKRIDLLRREGRPELKPEDFAHLTPDDVSADDRIQHAQNGRMIRDSLKQLPGEQAEVLRLAYFEDKSHRAISEQLGVPLGTVKSRIRLALARLRVGMSDEQHGPA